MFRGHLVPTHYGFFAQVSGNEPGLDRLARIGSDCGGTIMTKLGVSLLAGAGALFIVSTAQAAPLMPTAPAVDNGVENVRLVCNDWGRCWRTGGPRYYYRDSYNYYEPRYYRRHYHRGPGVQFNAPGVSFGFGVGPTW
jgi:hypothetical protein